MVAVTDEMLQDAVFGGELETAQELSLTNKSLHAVTLIPSLSHLRELNLAFNSITTVEPLSSLLNLQVLNVSHNQLKSLSGVQSLSKLEQLKAGNNKIRHISAVSECRALQALWLQQNDLRTTEHLAPLQSLSALTHIWLSPNPVTVSVDGAERRIRLLMLCPGLQSIDSGPVGAEERAAVAALSAPAEALLHDGRAIHQSVPRPRSDQGDAERLPPLQPRERAGERAAAYGEGETARGAFLEEAKASTPPKFGRRSSSFGSSTSTPPGLSRAQRKKTSAPIADDFGFGQVADMLPQISRKSSQQPPARVTGRRNSSASSTPPLSGRRIVTAPRRALEATIAAQSDQPQSSPQAVATDRKDISSATPSGRNDPVGPCAPTTSVASGRMGSGLYMTEYEVKYPKGSASAVIVRGDGSARLSWPNEDVAVSCESEMLGGRKSFRLYVHYRLTGNLAAAFEPDGSGFIQYPGGGVMLTYNIGSGDGALYRKDGSLERRWDDSGANGLSPLSDSDPLDMQLDQFLGVRVAPGNGPAGRGKPQMEVFFSCEGVKHRLVHGPNPAKHLWEASDYNGTGASSSGCADPLFLADLGGTGNNPRGAVRKVVVDRRPVDERMHEVSSITSTMQDLDSQLTSWLQSLKPS